MTTSKAGVLLSILAVLTGCCLEVVTGQGGITDATTGGATTGGTTTGGDSGRPPPCPGGGGCASDTDCVVAYCASEPCGGCAHFAVAKTLLSSDACLAEVGPVDGPTSTAPPACQYMSTVRCDCPAHPYCEPRCSSGICVCQDAGP